MDSSSASCLLTQDEVPSPHSSAHQWTDFSRNIPTELAEARLKSINDSDERALKIINADSGGIAAVTIWAHTKAMSDKDLDFQRK